MIDAIQAVTKTAIEQMEAGTARVSEGVKAAAETGESMKKIEVGAIKVLQSVDEISKALLEQTSASNDIAKSVEQTAQIAEENGAAVEEVSQSALCLDTLAQDLRKTASHFMV